MALVNEVAVEPADASSPRARRTLRRPAGSTIALLALLLVVCGAWWRLGRDLTFRGDDLDYLLYRRTWSWQTLLSPHVDHLTASGILMFRGMWAVFGVGSFAPYRLLNLGLLAMLLSLVFVVARRRAGATVALVLVALIGTAGPASEDVLWAFQAQFLLSLTAGVATLLTLDRADRRGDLASCALLLLAITSSGYGLVFIAMALIELALSRQWRRLLVPLVPLVAYLAWRLGYDPGGTSSLSPSAVLGFVVDSYAGTLGALTGLPLNWGRALAGGATAAVVVAIIRGGRPSPRATAALLLPVMAWLLTGVARAELDSPLTARYMLPNAVFLGVAASYVLPRVALRPPQLAVLAVLVVGAVSSNLRIAADDVVAVRTQATAIRSQLGVIELARASIDPGFIATPLPNFGNFRAQYYFEAVDDLGSFALPEGTFPLLDAPTRLAIDELAVRTSRLRSTALGPAAAAPTATRPAVSSLDARIRPGGRGCVAVAPRSGGVHIAQLQLPPTGVVVRPSARDAVNLRARRWADEFGPAVVGVATRPSLVRAAEDRGVQPWRVRLDYTRALRICSAPA